MNLPQKYINLAKDYISLSERCSLTQSHGYIKEEQSRAEKEEKLRADEANVFSKYPNQQRRTFIARFLPYEFKGENHLHNTYEELLKIYNRFKCVEKEFLPDVNDANMIEHRDKINKTFATEFVPVDHVYLVLKNTAPQSNYAEVLRDFNVAASETDKTLSDETTCRDLYTSAAAGAYHKIRTRVGNPVIRFYDYTPENGLQGKFLTDPIINKNRSIHVLLTPLTKGQSCNSYLLRRIPRFETTDAPRNCYDFTFSRVFNGMQTENRKNLIQTINNDVIADSDIEITMITFGQTGSGKTSSAIDILKDYVTRHSGLRFTAVQLYLTIDDDSSLKTNNVLHDLGKSLHRKNGNESLSFRHENAANVADNQFVFTVLRDEPEKYDASMLADPTFTDLLERYKLTRSTKMNPQS